MSIVIDGQMYFRTSEVCQKAGISKATLFRWFKENILDDKVPRDRKGWRLFAEGDLLEIQTEANKINPGKNGQKHQITPEENG